MAEHEFMKQKMNSYGKTWHTWKTRSVDQPGEALPLGPALLAWSFNHDELRGCLLSTMEKAFAMGTSETRRRRQDLVNLAHPQGSVNTFRAAFPNAKDVEGVTEKQDAQRAFGRALLSALRIQCVFPIRSIVRSNSSSASLKK
jgi:endonuclease I